MRQRWRFIGTGLLVAATVVLAWQPARVAVQTAFLVPSILDAGPRPLDWLTAPPHRQTLAWRTDATGWSG